VRLCQKIVTLEANDCASFYVVCVIQIMCMTQGTALLEQSSLAFHCHICCFISWSEVKFPCGIIVVQVWDSTYVVLIVKCVFILKTVCFLSFLRRNIEQWSQLVEKVCDIEYYAQKYIVLLYNSVFATWHFHQCFNFE